VAKKDWRAAHRCRVGRGGRVTPEKDAGGTCFVIERVKRNGSSGFVTTLHNRATGRRAAYLAPLEPGRNCSTTQDPFRAEIREKGAAVTAGASCAKKMSPPLKKAPADRKKPSRKSTKKKPKR
jgi:hypothetical protein